MQPLIAFRSRGFRLLWGSGVLGQVSRWMELTVLGWLVLDLTGSPFQVAMVGFFRLAPGALFGPFTGILSDRVNRKGALTVAALLCTVTLLVLATLVNAGLESPVPVFAAMFVVGTAWSLDFPSRKALGRDLLPPEHVVNGMSLESLSFTISRIGGPVAGGALIEFFGVGVAVAAIVVVYVAQVAFVFLLPRPARRVSIGQVRVFRSLLEGVRYAARSRVIAGVLVITIIMNILAFPLIQILPVFARDILDVGPFLLGLLSASHGVGAFIGSSAVAVTPRVKHGAAIFALSCVVVLTATLSFSFSNMYVVSVLLLITAGAAQAVFGTFQSALILLEASEETRGRMMGLLMLCISTGFLGLLLLGALSAQVGAPAAVAVCSLVGLALVVAAAVQNPAMRR